MKALKIKIYQNLCNYRREKSFGYIQSYPLPTPSMVRGMVHDILELNYYIPMKISIQGKNDGIAIDLQRVIKFDRDPKARPKNPYIVNVKNSKKTATNGIIFIDELINVELILHILFNSKDNEELLEKLYFNLQQKTPILGRNEDIARIDEMKFVNLNKVNDRTVKTKYSMYVLPGALIETKGIRFRLPFWYENVESFEDERIFHFIEVFYITSNCNSFLNKDYFLKDDDNDLVCLLEHGDK
ncbi:MAG: type I-B CRISPR-associated protein Cas5b [Patescibacteria group bacterium]|nr:type I-B CRISPR-associated protein Cas5b [Patescibacteria group bacterium]